MSERKTVKAVSKKSSGSGKKSSAKRSRKLKVFTLKLSKWLRGNSKNYERAQYGSALYDPTTKTYCCLGMFGRQCGIPVNELRDKATPEELFERRTDYPEDYRPLVTTYGFDSELAQTAMGINDSGLTSDEQKITALRPIFRKLGYRIEVVK